MTREREPIVTDVTPKMVRHFAAPEEETRPSVDLSAPWHQNTRTPQEEVLDVVEYAAATGDVEALKALQKQLDSELARATFAEFFRQAWKVVEPNTELVWNWHLALICAVVQAVFFDWLKAKKDRSYLNKIRNIVFNVPPGSSKSRILAVCFQAWAWLHCPGMKFICLSVNDDATMRDARAARDLIRSPWYVESFGIEWSIKSDQDAISNYGNTAGGERISMASKSEIVGLRADAILIDDANNPKKSESKNERDEINELWSTNQYNRVNDGMRSLRIGVQQRTHAADWTGNVISLQGTWSPDNRDGWLHVVIPAEFEEARRFVLPDVLVRLLRDAGLPESDLVFADPRTEEGDSIDPVRMPSEYLASERKRWAGTGNYAGQMQQSPVATEGNKVDRRWWNFFRLASGVRPDIDELEGGRPRPAMCHAGESKVIHGKHYSPEEWDFDWITISIDCASKKTEKGSNYGILVIGGKGGRRYVLDDATQRGALHEIIAVLVGTDDDPEHPRSSGLVQKWRPDSILIEPKAAGPDVMDTLIEQMGRGDVPMVAIWEAEPGNQDKEMRLEAAIPYIKNGMVYLLDGAPWLEEFVKELSLFPNGLRDDRVDALSQCLNHKRAVDDEWPDL